MLFWRHCRFLHLSSILCVLSKLSVRYQPQTTSIPIAGSDSDLESMQECSQHVFYLVFLPALSMTILEDIPVARRVAVLT